MYLTYILPVTFAEMVCSFQPSNNALFNQPLVYVAIYNHIINTVYVHENPAVFFLNEIFNP